MAVLRQANLLGQQRFDIPHIRSIESAVAADFDLLAGEIMAGKSPLVITGFDAITPTPGSPASNLQVRVAGAIILHPEASESGTIFKVPDNRPVETLNAANTHVLGSFTASSTNYVGIDLRRTVDATTADTVQFLNPETNLETPKTVPLARTLDYVFVISTQDFSTTPGIAPLVKVVTDSFNNVTSIEDARNFFMRLGSGGAITDPQHAYPWPGGRGEVGDNSDFSAGDKSIASLKEWMDAMMTRVWELGGGEYWYSATADRNVKLLRTGAYFSNGEWFEWDGTDLHWKGLTFLFDNSTATYNDIKDQTSNSAGLTNLADGECIYVDVDRTTNKTGGSALQPVKAELSTLSYPTIPGSRYVIAWRKGSEVFTRDTSFPVNASFRVATDTITGIVQLTYAAGNPALPKVAPQDSNGTIKNTGVAANAIGLQGTAGVGADGIGVKGIGGSNAADLDASTSIGNPGVYGIGGAGGATHIGGYGLYGQGGASGGAGGGTGVIGQGIGNGSGVFGLGNGTGAGGKFTGGASGGVGLVTFKNGVGPQVAHVDSDNHMRCGIDHNGFPFDVYLTRHVENWIWYSTSNTTQLAVTKFNDYPQMSYYIHSNVTGAALFNGATDFTLGQAFDYIRLTGCATQGTSVGTTRQQWIPNPKNPSTDAVLVFDALVSIDSGAGAVTGSDFSVGITNGALSTALSNQGTGVWFRKLNSDTYWTCVTSDNGTPTATVSSPATAPTAGVWQHLRFVMTNTSVKFYINGVLVATNMLNLPNLAQGLHPQFTVVTNGTTRSMQIGPYRVGYSHMGTPLDATGYTI